MGYSIKMLSLKLYGKALLCVNLDVCICMWTFVVSYVLLCISHFARVYPQRGKVT